MNTNYLLPYRYEKIGWFLFVPSVLIGFISLVFQFEPPFLNTHTFAFFDGSPLSKMNYFTVTETNAFDEIICLIIIVSSLLLAFSKTKFEDEYISKIRLQSLVWSVYVNYAILIFSILFSFGYAFFYALVFNMFTVLFCFIARFHWKIYRMPQGDNHEK